MDVTRDDERVLADYVDLIWRQKVLIVGVGALVGAVALASSLIGPRGYEATVTFAATPSKLGDAGQMAPNTAAFRPMVESLLTASQVISEVGLDKPPFNMRPSDFLDSIAINEVRGTSLITVKITLKDPALAARVANSVAEHAVQSARRVSSSEAMHARDLIKEQLDLARGRLDVSDAELRAYRQQVRLEAIRKDVEARLGGPQSPVFLPKNASAPAFVEDRSSGRLGLLDLAVKIASERARLAVLQRDLAARSKGEEGYRALDALAIASRGDLASFEQQRAQLMGTHQIDASTQSVLDHLYAVESEIAKRQVDRDVAEKTFTDLSLRYQEAHLQVIGKSSEFVIIDPALPPDRPTSRHVARNAVVAVAIWLCLVVAGILTLDFLQRQRRAGQR